MSDWENIKAVRGVDVAEPDEWQQGVALAVCFISGCEHENIDGRGPVRVKDDETLYYACTKHWEGIMRVLGEQRERAGNSERAHD